MHLLRVCKVSGENVARFGRKLRIGESDEQFVINVQTARVEIRGSRVNDVVRDDQLGVQYLRLVFVNLHAAAEQALIKTVRGQLNQRYIRCAGKNEPRASAAPGNKHQRTAEAEGW